MKCKFLLPAVLAAVASIVPSKAASIMEFASRTDFDAAVSGQSSENFNSFASDMPFHTTALDVGPFSLSMSPGSRTDAGRNMIEVPPVAFSDFDVDGSSIVNVLTSPGDSLIITFDTPIYAFGADFAAFNDGIQRTLVDVAGETLAPSVTPGNSVRFYGIKSDTPFSSIRLRGVGNSNDGYGIDNLSFSSTGPPKERVPDGGSTLALLGMVLAGFAGVQRVKARRIP